MVRRSSPPKSPCGCNVIEDRFRLIVDGPSLEPRGSSFAELLGNLPSQWPTPAYDRKLRLWFLHEEYIFPDYERDALVCTECDQLTDGIANQDDIDIYREQAGLNPEWHFERIN